MTGSLTPSYQFPPRTKKAKPADNNIMNSRTVGNLKRILTMPCATPPALFVETGIEALLGAFLGIVSPDPREEYHQLFGNSMLCSIKGGVKDADYFPPEDKYPALRGLWRFAEAVDLILWYTFVVDVAGDGLFNWSSNIIEQSGCAARSPYGFNGTTPFGACSADGSLDTLFEWFNSGPAPGPTCGSSIFVPPGWKWIAFCDATGQDVNGVPCSLTIELRDYTVPTIFDSDTSTQPAGGVPFKKAKVAGAGRVNKTDSVGHVIGFKGFNDQPMPDNEIFALDGTLYMDTYP